MATHAKTCFEKVWDHHVVRNQSNAPSILYIDLQLIHEVTSPQAFQMLRDRGLSVHRPHQTVATMDHSVPTRDVYKTWADRQAAAQIETLKKNCKDFGIPLHDMDSDTRGIVHVIGPELGLTQPGMTIVCGDSHTSTHGAFGALAFGIGTSEVGHVLATQTLLQVKPKTMKVKIDGSLSPGVTAKDVILALIAKIGVGGGTGHVIEYAGTTIQTLSMEERMTICNMSIEAGARAGMVAPDDTTFEYLAGRPHAPRGEQWHRAVDTWRSLPSDPQARFDQTVPLDASRLAPMITFGTHPGMGIPIDGHIPDPDREPNVTRKAALQKALDYMNLQPNSRLLDHPVDVVFIGSCTNGRLSDLRKAAHILEGQHISPHTRVMVVPGSQTVKKQAEAEGLDRIFKKAGADWRESGCSMCIAMNGDQLERGQLAVSTSNRNFEGRQGKGGRTILASPLTAAAAALTGKITDVRTWPHLAGITTV
jgi:3-isopropylmalate/(R)-2-methylmalate dehydratase large subunit